MTSQVRGEVEVHSSDKTVVCVWNESPYELFAKKGQFKHDDYDIWKEFVEYNHTLANRKYCVNRLQYDERDKSCSCLSVLKEGPSVNAYTEAVAEWQVMFGHLPKDDQKKIVIEWMRSIPDLSQYNQRFRIPFILSRDDDPQDFMILRNSTICVSALLDVLGKHR